MAQQFPILFSPIQIGKYTLQNRIVNTGHFARYQDERGLPSDRAVYYYRERARGGVGMIVIGTLGVHETSLCPFKLSDDSAIPGMQRIADAVHPYGTPILAQLTHWGLSMKHHLSAFEGHAVGPSADPVPTFDVPQIPAHELDTDEIAELVKAYGQAARRCVAGRLDGAEITMGADMLIAQFFSKVVNRRTDRYGGSLENRCRFALEVLQEVRSQLGPNHILGARFGDNLAGTLTPIEDIKEIVPVLVGSGLLDYVNVNIAGTFYFRSREGHIPSYYFEPGQFTYVAAEVKKVSKLPVVGIGRINHPTLAEQLLREGKMDLVGMVRELIADPHLPNKAREGRVDDIRRCLACNQSCSGHTQFGFGVNCIYNPVTGREKEWSELPPATHKKRVAVVGGGPAGMEAARVAALRGHQVVLFERSGELGGQVNIIAKAPKRDSFAEIRNFYEVQLPKAGVEVRLRTEATAAMLLDEQFDAVVVATGSTPYRPAFPGAEGKNVATAHEVVAGKAPVGQRVVVIDTQGYNPATDVADLLAEQGKQVEVVTGLASMGANLPVYNWRVVNDRLLRKGVVPHPFTGVVAIGEDRVETYSIITNLPATIEGVDTVVLAAGGRADDRLYRDLKGKVPDLYAIGDCLQPRDVEAAVYEGHKVARAL